MNLQRKESNNKTNQKSIENDPQNVLLPESNAIRENKAEKAAAKEKQPKLPDIVPSPLPAPNPNAESGGRTNPLCGKQLRFCICGRTVAPDARYCDACGETIEEEAVYRLIGISPGCTQLSVILGAVNVLGKSPECDVVIEQDDYVSGKHAQLSVSQGMLFIEDLGSSNGTFLRICRPTALEEGDEIVIGTSVFRVEGSGGKRQGQRINHVKDR